MTEHNVRLLVKAVRVMSLRASENGDPASVVAHVDAVAPHGRIAVIGEIHLRSPRDDNHLSAAAWEVTDSFVDRLPGLSIPIESHIAVERLWRALMVELKTQAAAIKASAAGSRRRSLRRTLVTTARRTARTTINRVRGRHVQASPERRPAGLIGIAAVRAALFGAVAAAAGATAGRDRGRSFTLLTRGNAQWYVGELDAFYEQNIERLGRYSCAPAPPQPSFDGTVANTFPDVESIGPLPKDGTKGHLLEREALRYGLNSTRFPSGAFVVSDAEDRKLNFKWGRSPIASGVSLSICSYKEATRRLLERVGVPVPRGRVFSARETDKALEYADRIGYPVVCKPVAGLRGIGVVSNIRDRNELVRALDLYAKSELGNDDFVIEQHVAGSDYRIVVVGGEVVAAIVREPASVVGDGVHTVVDLVEYKNRIRALNPHLRSRPIKFSDAMRYQLAQAGLTFGSVPERGQRVVLANSANLSQGGDSFEVAHELHPSIREAAIRAVQAVPGLGFCGLDMLIEDHRKPLTEQQVTVIELNAHAAIGSAQYPMWGTPTPVARLFFEECAEAYGLKLPDKQLDHLSLKFIIKGKVVGVNYRRWFKRRADMFGITGSIQNTGRKEVTALVDGPADAVSALAYLAIQGPRKTSAPSSVTVTHIDRLTSSEFEIIR